MRRRRVLALGLLVACGGSAATTTPTRTAADDDTSAGAARSDASVGARSSIDRAVRSRIGDGATCVGRASGVYCWGGDAEAPALVKELGRSTRIAGGCALTPDGDVTCVEEREAGRPLRPNMSKPLGDAIDLAAGGGSVCVVRRSGKVACWGFGYHRDPSAAKGDEAPTDLVEVGIDDAVSIAMGDSGRACAVRASGRVTCWAEIESWDHSEPFDVRGIDDAVGVTLGVHRDSFGCALRRTGEVACWGRGALGELGKAPGEARADGTRAPADVGVHEAVAVSAGAHHACALLRSGRVRCWGANRRGQLGDGTTTDRAEPVVVDGLDDATSIAAGHEHTCAERASGAVVCWGDNRFGALGNGLASDVKRPRVVPGVTGVAQVAAGASHTCVRHEDGRVSCWGEADEGDVARMRPTPVRGVDDAVDLVSGFTYSCAVRRSGRVSCWKKTAFGSDADASKVVDDPIDRARRVFARGAFSCVQRDDGEVLCAGDDSDGQLGTGKKGADPTYRALPEAKGALDVAAGYHHLCFVRPDGAVTCRGRGWSSPGSARRLAGLKDAVAISSTDRATCAIRKTGTVVCWNERVVPIRELRDATQLSTGTWRSCAVTRSGEVSCWQSADEDVGRSGSYNVAERVDGLADVRQVSVGDGHACALLRSGQVACWGSSRHGELGLGLTELSPRPTEVVGLPKAVE